MKIAHELTVEDLKNCNAMVQAASPAASRNRGGEIAVGLYGAGGVLLLNEYFGLSTAQFYVLAAFVVSVPAAIHLNTRVAIKKQVRGLATQTSMQREYVLADGALEVRFEDLTQRIPIGSIQRLTVGERGTLAHLAKSTPQFLPFGKNYRGDFVDALRLQVESSGGAQPPRLPQARNS